MPPKRSSITGGKRGKPPAWLRDTKSGDAIWVKAPAPELWARGTAVRFEGGKLLLKMADGTEVATAVDADMHPANKGEANDMCSLGHINEPSILSALESRMAAQDGKAIREEMFTYMASVIIAVNPLNGKLKDPPIERFIGPHERSPHPFDLAETAFQQMSSKVGEGFTNQSIVISGESGAGKTESSKIVLRHLTQRGSMGGSAAAAAGATDGLDRRMLDTNPLLEAFGNGKTLRNNNSSRFGKFMKLQFGDDGHYQLQGGMVETYLLEKSRVVTQIEGERNFHIFYQLLEGADGDVSAGLQLADASSFKMLMEGGVLKVDGINDKDEFFHVRTALSTIGATDAQQRILWQLLSGLCHLSNCSFSDEETSEGEKASLDAACAASMDTAAGLFGVERTLLLESITQRSIVSMGETIVMQRNAAAAGYAMAAVMKEVYSRLFAWVVDTINTSLGQMPDANPFIGVLDIFGFESFERNDYEQLLINFTNEVLQATFNSQVFKAEMELYKAEGLKVAPVQWPDNAECVELISSSPSGILALLDAEARTTKPKDEKFNEQLHKVHGFNPFCPKPHPKEIRSVFIVRHFAGNVKYTVGRFIDKNNNSVPADIESLFAASRLAEIAPAAAPPADAAPAKPGRKKKKGGASKAPTVAGIFKQQMSGLVSTLESTRCSFIRCIKPNATSTFGLFDREYVTNQMRCQGITQTCDVLRLGLPTRVPYAQIADSFRAQLPAEVAAIYASASDGDFVRAIMWAFEVPADAVKCGLTRIFFRVGKMALLDAVLQIDWAEKGEWVAARLRKYVQYTRWRRAFIKVKACNQFSRLLTFVSAKRLTAIMKIQSLFRGKKAREELKAKRAAAVESARRVSEESRRLEEEASRKLILEQAKQAAAEHCSRVSQAASRTSSNDSARSGAEAADAERAARKQAADAADAASREAAEKAAAEAAAQRAAAEKAAAAETAAKEEQARQESAEAAAKAEAEAAGAAAAEASAAARATEEAESAAIREQELAEEAERFAEDEAAAARLAAIPGGVEVGEDETFLEGGAGRQRTHSLFADAQGAAMSKLLDGASMDDVMMDEEMDEESRDALLETLRICNVDVTQADGSVLDHAALQEMAQEAIAAARGRRRAPSVGSRGSMMMGMGGLGNGAGGDGPDELEKSAVRASIRASVAQNAGRSGGAKARSNKSAHLMTVNQMMTAGWLEEDQASELQEEIMCSPDDAPFPNHLLEQWDLDINDLRNVLGEGEVASLGVEEGGAGLKEGEDEGDYTAVYEDELWQVAQLRCPQCSAMNSTARGNMCKLCDALMFGDPALVDNHKGGALLGDGDYDEDGVDQADGLGGAGGGADGWKEHVQLPDGVEMQKPYCEYKGGILQLSVYGCMSQFDPESLSEYTEYVITCEWGPPPGTRDADLGEHWLVAARFSEFKDMHKRLGKRLKPLIPAHLDFPKLGQKTMLLRSKEKKIQERQKSLHKLWQELCDLFIVSGGCWFFCCAASVAAPAAAAATAAAAAAAAAAAVAAAAAADPPPTPLPRLYHPLPGGALAAAPRRRARHIPGSVRPRHGHPEEHPHEERGAGGGGGRQRRRRRRRRRSGGGGRRRAEEEEKARGAAHGRRPAAAGVVRHPAVPAAGDGLAVRRPLRPRHPAPAARLPRHAAHAAAERHERTLHRRRADPAGGAVPLRAAPGHLPLQRGGAALPGGRRILSRRTRGRRRRAGYRPPTHPPTPARAAALGWPWHTRPRRRHPHHFNTFATPDSRDAPAPPTAPRRAAANAECQNQFDDGACAAA